MQLRNLEDSVTSVPRQEFQTTKPLCKLPMTMKHSLDQLPRRHAELRCSRDRASVCNQPDYRSTAELGSTTAEIVNRPILFSGCTLGAPVSY